MIPSDKPDEEPGNSLISLQHLLYGFSAQKSIFELGLSKPSIFYFYNDYYINFFFSLFFFLIILLYI